MVLDDGPRGDGTLVRTCRWLLASPVALAILMGCAVALRVGMIGNAPLDPDEAEHLNAAWLVGQGRVPYKDYWDHHAPLFFYATAPLVRLLADRPAIYPVGRLLMVATIQTDATVQAEAPRALFETTLPLLPNRVRPTRCRLTDSDGG